MILIDKLPPKPTGDTKQDLRNIYEYEKQLVEQLNFILTTIQKGATNGE